MLHYLMTCWIKSMTQIYLPLKFVVDSKCQHVQILPKLLDPKFKYLNKTVENVNIKHMQNRSTTLSCHI